MRSLLVFALCIGQFGCNRKDHNDRQTVVQEPSHDFLSDTPSPGTVAEITCYSSGTKIYEGQAVADSVVLRADRVVHFRVAGQVEADTFDHYVRVTGDCVIRHMLPRD